MKPTIARLIEIPPELDEQIKSYLSKRPEWNINQVCEAALSLFLLMEQPEPDGPSKNYKRACAIVLDDLLKHEV